MTCDYDPTDNPFLPAEERAEHAPHAPESVFVFQRRPSDPQELCSILGLCEACARESGWQGPDHVFGPDETPAVGTYHQVCTWCEDHGMANGVLWVS